MAIPEPRLEYRKAQPYVAIRGGVAMKEIGIVLPPLNREVFLWLQKQGMKPTGAPFWRYVLVDMAKKLEIDVALPVGALLRGGERIVADVLPAGVYVTALYVGHPDGLMQATADLLSWAEAEGIEWRMNGPRWGGRIERYLSDPSAEPDLLQDAGGSGRVVGEAITGR